ncbi:hypothetical protein L3049_10770 [Labilibaculum sp. DW002]|uniref:Uncharacterized protein n=1 Tax=Paralabilibaculum antarcticum TaxID=2912572 RepID=A0ABT5VSU4_9BACT|nr:hypothetical protein [Labilibaculum sp. DW002]MDE5418492.1 hypothetical protein [Labilibaculum sp. DW002]
MKLKLDKDQNIVTIPSEEPAKAYGINQLTDTLNTISFLEEDSKLMIKQAKQLSKYISKYEIQIIREGRLSQILWMCAQIYLNLNAYDEIIRKGITSKEYELYRFGLQLREKVVSYLKKLKKKRDGLMFCAEIESVQMCQELLPPEFEIKNYSFLKRCDGVDKLKYEEFFLNQDFDFIDDEYDDKHRPEEMKSEIVNVHNRDDFNNIDFVNEKGESVDAESFGLTEKEIKGIVGEHYCIEDVHEEDNLKGDDRTQKNRNLKAIDIALLYFYNKEVIDEMTDEEIRKKYHIITEGYLTSRYNEIKHSTERYKIKNIYKKVMDIMPLLTPSGREKAEEDIKEYLKYRTSKR